MSLLNQTALCTEVSQTSKELKLPPPKTWGPKYLQSKTTKRQIEKRFVNFDVSSTSSQNLMHFGPQQLIFNGLCLPTMGSVDGHELLLLYV